MIREATLEDIKAIVNVHFRCFPDSFSTQMGGKGYLLERFYQEYMLENPELFFVSEVEKLGISGFCMGYFCEKKDFRKKYLKHNFLRICIRMLILLLSGNKLAWKALFRNTRKTQTKILNTEVEKIPLEKRGDLLSICVLPEFRGDGTAKRLIDRFQDRLKQSGRCICQLTVHLSNVQGIKFYEKNGYFPYKEKDNQERTFVKKL